MKKARAISRDEELFGVPAVAASAAELLRRGQLEIKVVLGIRRMSVAPSGDVRMSAVQDFLNCHSRPFSCHGGRQFPGVAATGRRRREAP